MLTLEKAKEKTNSWTKKINTKKLSKYSHFPQISQFCVSPVPIQENSKSFNLLKDNNCDIYLSNQIKTEASKVSLLRTKSWKQEAFSWREEKVLCVSSQQSLLKKSKTRKAKQITNRPSSYLLRQAEIKDTFMKLANQWRSETKHMSLMSDMILHTAYQQIIGMGTNAVPLILEELSREPEHWFWALRSITGANPIKPEDRGRVKKMAEAWLDWGRQHGYKC
ncbi:MULTISPECIES: hypothetical protein [unclassified Nostoc]|uniref:hypothetical protein n=1 Tax=unclassified Nostoc TaxID=2593658 RepID=UPI0026016AEA|nr:hypothetical protein [Nostoc sp. S13]MDF5735474.1 hypothetical protein [Nostoc sp. S13]